LSDRQTHPYAPVRARGTSMNLAGIVAGTVLYIDSSRAPRHGDIVVAHVRDKGDTIKRWRETRDRGNVTGAWLWPESNNPRWLPTRVNDDVSVTGVVVAIERDGIITYDIPSHLRRPAPVVDMNQAVAAKIYVGEAMANADLPPLAFYLLGLQSRTKGQFTTRLQDVADELQDANAERNVPFGMTELEFEAAIGLDRGELAMIWAGQVPEAKVLGRIARRISVLLGEAIAESELLGFRL
jgi:hypothetical protein